ncbi:MAG: sugar phosphate nucleotidyltransferase [Saprospiraceae bacterium]
MKAIIPVAGVGTRLRPHTYTQPKPLIPVAGKPIIFFIIDQLVAVGVTEFVFIIGHLGDKIEIEVTEAYPDLEKEFIVQNHRSGIAHAIWIAKETFENSDQILIILGDTIIDDNIKPFIDSPQSCFGVKKVNDPREFGIAEFNDAGEVVRVVEKPQIPISNMALVGWYKITDVKALLSAIQYNIEHNITTYSEYQLTDAIMRMIENEHEFKAIPIKNWFDCGKREILLLTNETLLKKYAVQNKTQHEYPNTIIIPPVSIGKNCQIKDSIIGPYVTIGNQAKIQKAIVNDSIIGDFSTIETVILNRSIIGSDASIKGTNQSLNIGDNTEIDFS